MHRNHQKSSNCPKNCFSTFDDFGHLWTCSTFVHQRLITKACGQMQRGLLPKVSDINWQASGRDMVNVVFFSVVLLQSSKHLHWHEALTNLHWKTWKKPSSLTTILFGNLVICCLLRQLKTFLHSKRISIAICPRPSESSHCTICSSPEKAATCNAVLVRPRSKPLHFQHETTLHTQICVPLCIFDLKSCFNNL